MAPKRRQINKHLPPRVYLKHSAYWYVDLKNKWTRLGKTLSQSMETWSRIVNPEKDISIMNQLFDRYMLEIAPLKSKSSYRQNLSNIKWLRISFGEMKPEDVTPQEIYRFMDMRARKARVGANREKSLLSHVFSMGIKWGIVNDNPCSKVKRHTERARDRYIEDFEYKAVQDVAPELIINLMDFAYLTGQRIGDILKIKLSDIVDEGIRIEQSKGNGKVKLIIQWSAELKKCVETIKIRHHSKIVSMTLFCNQKGEPLTYDGFSTIWSKSMKEALQKGNLKSSFTFHDIRAKSSSDAQNRQAASELLGHADIRTTERVYNRKHRKVVPIR